MAQRKKNAGGADQAMYLVITVLGAWAIWEWIINPWIQQHQASTTCYDVNGNAIQCPAGYSAGQTVGTVTATPVYQPVTTTTTPPVATPTTQNTATTQNYLLARAAAIGARTTTATALAARQAALQNETALQSTRSKGSGTAPVVGMHGITPSWPAGGGPAFNHFIPGGGMTFGGANAFGSPAYGVMESLPKHGWIQ